MPLTHPISSIRSGGSLLGSGSTRAAVAFTVSANCTVNQIVRILFQGSGYSTSSSTRIGIATALSASPTWLGYHDGALTIDGSGNVNSIVLNTDCALTTGTTYYLVVQDDGGSSAVLTTANLSLTGMSWGVLFTDASYSTNNGSGFGFDVDFGNLTADPPTVDGAVSTIAAAAPAGTASAGTPATVGGVAAAATTSAAAGTVSTIPSTTVSGSAASATLTAPAGTVHGETSIASWTIEDTQRLTLDVQLFGTLSIDVTPIDPPAGLETDGPDIVHFDFDGDFVLDDNGRPV